MQTIHGTTQITTNLEGCGLCPVSASFTLTFVLQLRKKHGKNLGQGKKNLSHFYIYSHAVSSDHSEETLVFVESHSNQAIIYAMFVMFGRKVGRQFHGSVYNRMNSTTSPASGVGNISEPRVMPQVGGLREFVCAWIYVFLQSERGGASVRLLTQQLQSRD